MGLWLGLLPEYMQAHAQACSSLKLGLHIVVKLPVLIIPYNFTVSSMTSGRLCGEFCAWQMTLKNARK